MHFEKTEIVLYPLKYVQVNKMYTIVTRNIVRSAMRVRFYICRYRNVEIPKRDGENITNAKKNRNYIAFCCFLFFRVFAIAGSRTG